MSWKYLRIDATERVGLRDRFVLFLWSDPWASWLVGDPTRFSRFFCIFKLNLRANQAKTIETNKACGQDHPETVGENSQMGDSAAHSSSLLGPRTLGPQVSGFGPWARRPRTVDEHWSVGLLLSTHDILLKMMDTHSHSLEYVYIFFISCPVCYLKPQLCNSILSSSVLLTVKGI